MSLPECSSDLLWGLADNIPANGQIIMSTMGTVLIHIRRGSVTVSPQLKMFGLLPPMLRLLHSHYEWFGEFVPAAGIIHTMAALTIVPDALSIFRIGA